jgi:KTSC domain
MIRVAIISTELGSIGYDDAVRCLEAKFQNGGVYQYFEVPADEYNSLMMAASKGQYFNARIRTAYSCERIDP